MAWHIVEKLIEQSGEHSSLIGKFWVTSFFVLRLLIVGSIAASTWDGSGSQSDFICNTESPGCKSVCFNEYSPVDLTRYWSLQILGTSLPSLIFIVFTAHKMDHVNRVVSARKEQKKKEKEEEKLKRIEEKKDDGKSDSDNETEDDDDEEEEEGANIATRAPQSHDVPSKLYIAYFLMVVCRTLIEIAFIIGQYYLYTFKFWMPELWQCQHWPCPSTVDCYVSRPKEKSIMICIFYATGCIMVCLNLMELFHLAGKVPKAWRERGDDITKHVSSGPNFGETDYAEWAPGVEYIEAPNRGYPDPTAIPTLVRPGHFPGGGNRYGRRARRHRRRY